MAGQDSVEVNGASVGCNRDRANNDDILLRNSTFTVIPNHQQQNAAKNEHD